VIALDLPLIGPAASILEAARALAQATERLAILLHGTPGVGKTHLLDLLALELTRSKFAIEHVNGQSVSVDLVRQWRERGCYGNLFSDWTVKRIDELDHAGGSASGRAAHAARLPPATRRDPGHDQRLRQTARREQRPPRNALQSLPRRCTVDRASRRVPPRRFKLPAKVADAIAHGAVPDGCLSQRRREHCAALHRRHAQTYIAARCRASHATRVVKRKRGRS
jgi:hypothetical protein